MCVAVRGLTFLDGGGSRRKIGKGDSGTPSNASLRTTFGKMNFCLTQKNNISKAAPQPDSRASMLRTRIQNVLHLSNNGKHLIRPSKKKKQMFLVRISFKKRAGGRFFFLLLVTFYYFQLEAFFTHYYLPPRISWSS